MVKEHLVITFYLYIIQYNFRVVFCDSSNAFDRVWHKGLLHKLALMGIS